MVLTWDVFKKELLAQFGPMEYEDFDEVLAQIKQYGTFLEYHREFERLANWVVGWLQKALYGTFLRGLKEEIATAVRMF